jgi:hypothetical protein
VTERQVTESELTPRPWLRPQTIAARPVLSVNTHLSFCSAITPGFIQPDTAAAQLPSCCFGLIHFAQNAAKPAMLFLGYQLKKSIPSNRVAGLRFELRKEIQLRFGLIWFAQLPVSERQPVVSIREAWVRC